MIVSQILSRRKRVSSPEERLAVLQFGVRRVRRAVADRVRVWIDYFAVDVTSTTEIRLRFQFFPSFLTN